jgi:hypothetical protein
MIKSDRSKKEIETVIYRFESTRDYLKGKIIDKNKLADYTEFTNKRMKRYQFLDAMISIYNQRASMGSTDALSVIYRDIILSVFTDIMYNENSILLQEVNENFARLQNMNSVLEEINNCHSWGEKIQ